MLTQCFLCKNCVHYHQR